MKVERFVVWCESGINYGEWWVYKFLINVLSWVENKVIIYKLFFYIILKLVIKVFKWRIYMF